MIKKISLLSATVASVEAVQVKGKCPFGYTSSKPDSEELLKLTATHLYPSDTLTCAAGRVAVTPSFTKAEYEELAMQIINLQHSQDHQLEDHADFAACLLRLAGHDLMDFRREMNYWRRTGKLKRNQPKAEGGSDGCINYSDEDNTGLPQCLTKSGINAIYEQWCHRISLADFIVLAAEATTGSLAVGYVECNPFNPGTLLGNYKDQFQFGRETLEQCPDNTHKMPNPELGCDHLQEIFIEHIYNGNWNGHKAWALTAALSGAHTIGSAKTANSGYDGFWGDPANQKVFNNDYFRNIMAHGWVPDLAVKSEAFPNGNPNKNQWKISDQIDSTEKGRQMMLDSDMCMYFRNNHKLADCYRRNNRVKRACMEDKKGGDFITAKTANHCCAWTGQGVLAKRSIVGTKSQSFCGVEGTGGAGGTRIEANDNLQLGNQEGAPKKDYLDRKLDAQRAQCCVDVQPGYDDCDSYCPNGPAVHPMWRYAGSNDYFYEAYLEAWKIGTENGWSLTPLLESAEDL